MFGRSFYTRAIDRRRTGTARTGALRVTAGGVHGVATCTAIAAIQKGGVSVLEITMTVPGAVELIRDVARRATDALVGAGTVLDPKQAR